MNTYSNHTQIAYDLNMHCFAVHELHSNQIRNKRKNDALIHFDGSIQADSMTLMCCSFYRINHFPKSFPVLFLCVGSTPSASLCLLQMTRDTDHYWKCASCAANRSRHSAKKRSDWRCLKTENESSSVMCTTTSATDRKKSQRHKLWVRDDMIEHLNAQVWLWHGLICEQAAIISSFSSANNWEQMIKIYHVQHLYF